MSARQRSTSAAPTPCVRSSRATPPDAVLFTDFLKSTVLVSAAAASALAAVTVAGGARDDQPVLVLVMMGWWGLAGLFGLWSGRRAAVNPAIARLLAAARTQSTLPEVRPGRMLVNRLWPLFLACLAAGAFALWEPQVPGIAAGFPIIWALTWRRQEAAVTALEDRDGVRFYLEPTKPWQPISLVRTPGFKALAFERGREKTEALP